MTWSASFTVGITLIPWKTKLPREEIVLFTLWVTPIAQAVNLMVIDVLDATVVIPIWWPLMSPNGFGPAWVR